ncbi:MAG: hypothetical protein VB072_06095 [Lentimicrobium sp.]|uniref:hypothetical protein n=1 Tax=Lentimicrobium sp. TaxID=2034841 RepID=UPI002B21C192|nr:hypothetical protein [Lentimicrobium sp.]MEA5109981.1 hypothetical protein [Lentimicrobium sp.]
MDPCPLSPFLPSPFLSLSPSLRPSAKNLSDLCGYFFNHKARKEDVENAENLNVIVSLCGPLRKTSATSAVFFNRKARKEDAENAENFNGIVFLCGPLRFRKNNFFN